MEDRPEQSPIPINDRSDIHALDITLEIETDRVSQRFQVPDRGRA